MRSFDRLLPRGFLWGILLILPVLSACQARLAPSGEQLTPDPPQRVTASPTSALEPSAVETPTWSPAPSPVPNLIGTATALLSEATALPSAVPITSTPTAVPTPAPVLRQLTSGGCCVQPFWSPDGQRVLYIDRPAADAPAGLWGVGLEGGEPQLYTDRLGLYSGDMQLLAYPQNGLTVIERPADGQRWTLSNGERAVSFSPDGTQLAWTGGQSGPPYDTARREVWLSQVDGSQARHVLTVFGGGLAGWFPDGRLLVSGKLNPAEDGQAFWVVSPGNGAPREIARASRPRGGLLSPGGSWLAYMVAFGGDPAENGIWLVNIASGERFRLELFGAYQWRDDHRLLVVPLDPGAGSQRVWQVDANLSGDPARQARPLTDPAVTPFKIANGDWFVSPDGGHIAFVSADDHNIWLLSLAPEAGP